jgi:hypothetical protein
MKSKMFFIGCVVMICLSQMSNAQEKKPEVRPVQIGIVYPLSTNGVDAYKVANVFSINCFMGMSAGVEAAEFSGFMSITNGNVNGIQGSGFLNVNNGNVHGVHAAGFVNVAKEIDGVQAAGFINVVKDIDGIQAAGFVDVSDDCDGAQLSGFVGVADNVKSAQLAGFVCVADSIDGIQGSGFININDKTKGAQLTGFVNVSGDIDGAQGAGFINIGKDVKGAQLSGFVNVAKDVKGAQASGFLNIARNVKGAQISGFMNIADSCDYPIGVINWVKNGTKQIVVETDENTAVNVLFKSGGRRTYGNFGLSYLPSISGAQYGIVAGIGVHFPVSTSMNIDVDGTSNYYYDYSFKKNDYKYFISNQLRILLNYKINNRISVFAGPKLSFASSENKDIDDLRGLELWSGNIRHGNNRHFDGHQFDYNRLLLGANVGVEINLN